MNKVAFVDLYQQHQAIEEELVEVFRRVLRKSSFILGPEVVAFEKEFAAYVGAADCIAVNNGTTALQLVLAGLGIGPGDEVITVANTFIATAEAISAVGARPVFVDVDPVSFTMDPAAGRSGDYAEHQGALAGTSLRPGGGCGCAARNRASPQSSPG